MHSSLGWQRAGHDQSDWNELNFVVATSFCDGFCLPMQLFWRGDFLTVGSGIVYFITLNRTFHLISFNYLYYYI